MSGTIEKKITAKGIESLYLGKNLRYLMNKNNVDAKQLHAKTGIVVTTINQLKRGIGNPTMNTLIALAQFFNVQIDDLIHTNLEAFKVTKKRAVRVPILEMELITNDKLHQSRSKEFVTVDADNFDLSECFATKITNNAMSPMFDKGTIFIVAPNINPNDGDMVLVKFGTTVPCFKRVYIEGGKHFFDNIANLHRPQVKSFEKYNILGVVIKSIQQHS